MAGTGREVVRAVPRKRDALEVVIGAVTKAIPSMAVSSVKGCS